MEINEAICETKHYYRHSCLNGNLEHCCIVIECINNQECFAYKK